MQIKLYDTKKRCEIWVPHAERATFRNDPAYLDAVARSRSRGYRVCVYVGGVEPLLPNITALLDRQNGGLLS
ncbi:MAG: hypothetical protein AB7C89_08420 [Intestinibacillus sp.]